MLDASFVVEASRLVLAIYFLMCYNLRVNMDNMSFNFNLLTYLQAIGL